MFKNYFYLNRAVIELSEMLIGSTIFEVFTQEKETLYFHIPTEENEYRHLVVSINQSEPYLIIKDEHRKARKNVANFYSDLLPDKIEAIQIAQDDRIIKIICTNFYLLIPIRGTISNVIALSEHGEPEFFRKVKRVDETELIADLNSHSYNTAFNIPEINNEIKSLDELKKSFSYLTKDILNELKSRTSTDNFDHQKEILLRILSQINNDPIQIFYTNDLNRFVFVPSGFISLSRDSEVYEYDNYQDALLKLLAVGNKLSREQKLQKEISKHIGKELSIYSNKLNSLQQRVDEGSKEELYRKYADLLLSNMQKIKKGMKEITVDDFTTSETYKISLNDKFSPKQNVDYYYDKARGERINYSKSLELYQSAKSYYDKILDIQKEFENCDDLSKLISLKEKLGLKDQKVIEKNEPQMKFRHFIIENKYHVFVGRDSKSNDFLSTKFAKQNDYWFHARGYAGSHVVLRVDNPKEGVPKNIIKNAASIAAYFSKAKTAGTAPVAYTFAKFVTKRKGMEPGKVMMQKENVLLVKPEIPSNTEQVED
ncbi:MAG TPA: DUF814 domain-containing protein [Ignavibacteria bacterium]|nr:DUF814 domain-containing protein [Ignavibacteria bacterium]